LHGGMNVISPLTSLRPTHRRPRCLDDLPNEATECSRSRGAVAHRYHVGMLRSKAMSSGERNGERGSVRGEKERGCRVHGGRRHRLADHSPTGTGHWLAPSSSAPPSYCAVASSAYTWTTWMTYPTRPRSRGAVDRRPY
jgi:hypothetical protein